MTEIVEITSGSVEIVEIGDGSIEILEVGVQGPPGVSGVMGADVIDGGDAFTDYSAGFVLDGGGA